MLQMLQGCKRGAEHEPSPALQLELELEGVKNQLQDANSVQLHITARATSAEERVRVSNQAQDCCLVHLWHSQRCKHVLQDLETKLQDESELLKALQKANLEAATAGQQQNALKQHVIQ